MAIIDRRGIAVDGSSPSSADTPDVALAIKVACRVASTANLTLTGLQTVDAVSLHAGDRVLVKDQTDGTQNGIYKVSSGNWIRTDDLEASSDLASGILVAVVLGTISANLIYQLTTPDPIALDIDNLTFVVVSGAPVDPLDPIPELEDGYWFVGNESDEAEATSPSGALVGAFGDVPNLFIACDVSGVYVARALVGDDLPNPTAITRGGVFASPESTTSLLSGIDIDGNPTRADMVLPTAGAGTLVDLLTPQTLSTKTLDSSNTIVVQDASFTLVDNGDQTKIARFQLSSLTTAAIRIFSLPDSDGTLASDATHCRRGQISGLTLSAAGSTATFGIAVGECMDSLNTRRLDLASAYTKTTSAWAVGTGNGAMDTGAVANNTWYHVHLIKRLDTGVTDVLFSLSATSPTLPTNYARSRRIGSMRTNGSAQWIKFTQLGDEFLWDVPVETTAVASFGTSRTSYPASGPRTPTGVKVTGIYSIAAYNSSATLASIFLSPDQADTAPSATSMFSLVGNAATYASGRFFIRTDTSAQITGRADQASSLLYIVTEGWIDTRGRFE